MALKEAYTAQELAILLGCAVQSANRTAKHENWQYRKRAGRGGGNEWLVSSMPDATQRALQMAEERRAIEEESAHNAALPTVVASQLPSPARQAILDDKRRYKALAKADLLDLYLNWQRKYGATVSQKEAFIHAYQGGAWSKLLTELGPRISWKSLERWKLEQKKAGSVLALADARGLAHRGKSMLTEQHRSIILGQVMDGDRQISTCVRIIQARCQAENIAIPSEDTIRRWVSDYSRVSFQNWTLFRKGEKAWNDDCALSILRDWSLVDVGDIVIADGHTLNFETINPETGKPCRMTLLLYFDGASRYPLGWEVMATENTQCIASAFRRACIRLGKFPRVVYLDNGKAFRSRFFKGCPDFEQAGFLGLYRDLGCAVIHAWPYHGQSKPIERFFGTMHELEELTPSYTGWNIDHKPARLQRNEKLHRRLHEKLGRGPLTLEETHYWLAAWFEMYAARPQTRTHLKGKTPGEVFLDGRGPGVDVDRLTLMMLQKEIRTISKDGIRMFGRLYWSEELSNRRHPVLVRYDLQLSPYTVLVYDLEGNKICEARDREHYKIACGIHPAASVLGTEEQRRDLSEALALTKSQAREAKSGIKGFVEGIIVPEVRQSQQIAKAPQSIPAEKKVAALSPKDKAVIEAAKAQALLEQDDSVYQPSMLRRWPDEPSRYAYIWDVRYEQNVELVPEDAAFMDAFEQTPQYQNNYKSLYDTKLELRNFRRNQCAAAG
ncbi:Mu transposase C-terminal domain-containing protein [Desulfovibrio sp. ZJ369]|uniref:Mu transposase C-terminal domain-containing protein n=1 Tax=Desulfovibrio sp. ZJ369 TaxID=2709793 RepID=UPI0013ED481C|nr:Mu transposase C-terminal domain-containing protein [Desulfovibrio sp. ZJ369]